VDVDDLFDRAKNDNTLMWWEALDGDAKALWEAVVERCRRGDRANRARVVRALQDLGVSVSYPTVQQTLKRIEAEADSER